MKRTKLHIKIALVDGPAQKLLGKAEILDQVFADHEEGDSGSLSNAADAIVTHYFEQGVETHFMDRVNHKANVRIAPSQIAWVTYELAAGERV